jgi:hypothetical protein
MDTTNNGLKDSLDRFEAGCKDIGLEPEHDVRVYIEKLFEKRFGELKHDWKVKGEQVLAAARFAGRYAASYAQLKGSTVVKKTHANRGLEEAKALCTARRIDKTASPRREWCKGVTIPSDPIEPEPA